MMGHQHLDRDFTDVVSNCTKESNQIFSVDMVADDTCHKKDSKLSRIICTVSRAKYHKLVTVEFQVSIFIRRHECKKDIFSPALCICN